MKAIETITGPVSVLNRDDVDTDQIIPKQFLKRVDRTGFGEFLVGISVTNQRGDPSFPVPSFPVPPANSIRRAAISPMTETAGICRQKFLLP